MANFPEGFDESGRFVGPGITRAADLTPVQVKLPDIADLKGLTKAELLTLSQRYGIYPPNRQMRLDAAQYVKDYSKIPPNSPEFTMEVERLTNPKISKRASLNLARRAQREYQQIIAQNGDENQVFVRIGEGDDNMCEDCERLEGEEGTRAYHESIGMPGRQRCGENCRCSLMPVEKRSGSSANNLLEKSLLMSAIRTIL